MWKLDSMQVKKENILLVEGYTDKNFIHALLGAHEVNLPIEIKPCGNDSGCIEEFWNHLNSYSNYNSIGMIVDADKKCSERYKVIQEELNNHLIKELKLPDLPEKGLIHQYHGTQIGIWIMPNCKGVGALESFLYNKIQKDNSLLIEVQKALEALEKRAEKDTALKVKMYNPSTHKKKAIVHTYMSWKEPPDLSFGTALKANFFPVETTEENAFIEWLKKMYQPKEGKG